MFAEERKQKIVNLVNKNIKTSVAELCDYFSVSPATIRNDLRELEFAGLLKRTHGGAIKNKKTNYEPTSVQKEVENIELKQCIAEKAIGFVQEGDTIVLDTGTTMLEFAKRLAYIKNLTIVTYDIKIAYYLEENSDANVILAGGVLRRNFHCTIGSETIGFFNNMNVDKAFLSANGVSVDKGVTTPNMEIAQIKRKIMSFANEVVLLTDSSKIGKISFVKFADLSEFDVIFSDSNIDSEYLEKIKDKIQDVQLCEIQNKNVSE